ncbi:hypothetical protein DL95DRAFT_330681 [Leptodontidium sp. 2 PMI_412]|nr:hypothetical protein DL95DRAFT_330681 [Leptodontidium sp. 2 PMI_412]
MGKELLPVFRKYHIHAPTMPRPKRTKVAPSAPVPRVKKSAKIPPPVAAAPEPPKATFDDLYDVSDAEDRAPTSARRARRDNGKEKAGAASSMEKDRMSLEDPAEESSLPEIDLDSSSPSIETGRKEQRTPTVESSMLAIGNFRRRPRQPSILGRGPGRARSSSIESNLAEDNGLMSVGRRNTSAIGIGNFKRRPRERSIMGRNAAVAPSSMGLDMDRGTPAHVGSAIKIGTFKRREREPSILRTAQKARQEEAFDYDDDEDDFHPEDESTPLNLSKTRNMTTDDDELSYLNVQARSRRHTSVRARTPAALKRGGKLNRPVPKPKDSTVKRTYGSRANAASDKENTVEVDPDDSLAPIPDDDPDDPENSQELEERVGKELKRAAKKFQEVDKWELEFEEVTASSSSPRDGR